MLSFVSRSKGQVSPDGLKTGAPDGQTNRPSFDERKFPFLVKAETFTSSVNYI